MSETSSGQAVWNFDNSYLSLGEPFYTRQNPVPVRNPHMVLWNAPLAEALGLDSPALAGEEGARLFSGNQISPGAIPIAQAYAGHQFGGFTMLGDGRAILLGEQITPAGQRFDIQLKGSGPTPYSRRGDGRAALGPMLREYIISEAMHALGIPTTRSLAVVATGEPVFRETSLPGAILTRVAASHIRVGTFEFAAALDGNEAIRSLADYTVNRHFPKLSDAENKYLSLLNSVMDRQASLVAKWMHVGFIHGVMNTDNMALSGETIDYGPCAFMDAYDPATVFSSIDQHGRYAFANQPHIAQWNLARFAETLLPLLHGDANQSLQLAQEAIGSFPELFQMYWLAGMRKKLGLFTEEVDDLALINDLLECMQRNQADYTNTFRNLAADAVVGDKLQGDASFKEWLQRWRERLSRQPENREAVMQMMQATSPAVIPRNHNVEAALAAAAEGDMTVAEHLLAVLAEPFSDAPVQAEYCMPAASTGRAYKTFCGT